MIKDTISILFDLKEIAKKRKLNHRENYRIYGNLIYSNKFKIFGFFWTAILQKKIGRSPLVIKEYIEEYDVDALLSDNAELLLKFIPTETEVRVQRHLDHSGTVGIAYQLQLFGPFRQSSEKHVFSELCQGGPRRCGWIAFI